MCGRGAGLRCGADKEPLVDQAEDLRRKAGLRIHPEEGSAGRNGTTVESQGTAAPSTAPELAADVLNPLAVADSPRDNDPLGRTTPLRPKNQFVRYTGTGGGCIRRGHGGPTTLD